VTPSKRVPAFGDPRPQAERFAIRMPAWAAVPDHRPASLDFAVRRVNARWPLVEARSRDRLRYTSKQTPFAGLRSRMAMKSRRIGRQTRCRREQYGIMQAIVWL
jgi:hypothetical protein